MGTVQRLAVPALAAPVAAAAGPPDSRLRGTAGASGNPTQTCSQRPFPDPPRCPDVKATGEHNDQTLQRVPWGAGRPAGRSLSERPDKSAMTSAGREDQAAPAKQSPNSSDAASTPATCRSTQHSLTMHAQRHGHCCCCHLPEKPEKYQIGRAGWMLGPLYNPGQDSLCKGWVGAGGKPGGSRAALLARLACTRAATGHPRPAPRLPCQAQQLVPAQALPH